MLGVTKGAFYSLITPASSLPFTTLRPVSTINTPAPSSNRKDEKQHYKYDHRLHERYPLWPLFEDHIVNWSTFLLVVYSPFALEYREKERHFDEVL